MAETEFPTSYWIVCTNGAEAGFHISDEQFEILKTRLGTATTWVEFVEVTGRIARVQLSHISDIRQSTPESREKGDEYKKFLDDADSTPEWM